MCNTAVMQFVRDLRQTKFIIDDELFDLFDFMGQIEFFYGDCLLLPKTDWPGRYNRNLSFSLR